MRTFYLSVHRNHAEAVEISAAYVRVNSLGMLLFFDGHTRITHAYNKDSWFAITEKQDKPLSLVDMADVIVSKK